MKNVEERLKELPRMADSSGLQANEALKRKILQSAREGKKARKSSFLRYAPVFCCAMAVLICAVAVIVLGTLANMGGLFAYYCMFAAIAVEFIAAVYYTFQLN